MHAFLQERPNNAMTPTQIPTIRRRQFLCMNLNLKCIHYQLCITWLIHPLGTVRSYGQDTTNLLSIRIHVPQVTTYSV